MLFFKEILFIDNISLNTLPMYNEIIYTSSSIANKSL